MASGDLIKYSNFSNTYTEHSIMDYENKHGEIAHYAYVSSPSWYMHISFDKGALIFGNANWVVSYWNGSDWIKAYEKSIYLGSMESGNFGYYFYHNSTLGSNAEDVPQAVLWEIYFYYMKPMRKRLWIYTGGIGCMSESTYDDIYKGKLIYSAGNLSGDSCWNAGEDGAKRNEALSLFSQSANRGTLITASNEKKLVAYKYN